MPRLAAKTALKRGLGYCARRLETSWRPDPARWNLRYQDDGLSLHGVALESLAERHGSPLHVVDFTQLEANMRAMLEARSAAGAGCRVLYSYKTNPVPAVLERLHASGGGAEVISPFELWLALRLGVPGRSIIYNGSAKSEASLRTAIDAGIACINANSLGDLRRIGEAARALDRPADIALRIVVRGGWAGQFGWRHDSPELARAVVFAREHSHLRLLGVHAHRGILMRSAAEVRAHVASVMAARSQLQAAYGIALPLVDVGGSLACPTTAAVSGWSCRMNRSLLVDLPPPAIALSPGAYARLVLETVADCSGAEPAPEVVLEPGRAVTGNTQMLLTTVADVRPDPDGFDYAILDAGIHNAESMRSEQHAILPLQPPRDAQRRRYRLVGPLCTPGDVLRYSVRLPRLEVGDRLALMDTGAYFVPFSSPFSFPRPAVVGIDGGREILLTARERWDDIISRDRIREVAHER